MATLMEIGEDMKAVAALLEEAGGDVSEADAEAAIDRWLQESRDSLHDKLDGYGAIMREMENRAAFRRAEAGRLLALATVGENNVKRMKDRLRRFFEAQGITKVEAPRFRFSLVTNGGAAPLHVLVPPETLPEAYRVERVTYSADSAAIRAALEKGEDLDFALIGERGKHVSVK